MGEGGGVPDATSDAPDKFSWKVWRQKHYPIHEYLAVLHGQCLMAHILKDKQPEAQTSSRSEEHRYKGGRGREQ